MLDIASGEHHIYNQWMSLLGVSCKDDRMCNIRVGLPAKSLLHVCDRYAACMCIYSVSQQCGISAWG